MSIFDKNWQQIDIERDVANESENYFDNVQKRINLIIIRFDKNHR